MSDDNVTKLPKKGFRNAKKPNKAQQIDELQKMLANLQMAVRVSQMGLQQIGGSIQRMEKDLSGSMGVLNDIQYRTLAMMKLLNVDKDNLETIAEEMKLKDFNEASDKEDVEKKYEVADIVESDSIVIITSECVESPEAAIFRSKFKLDESANAKAMEIFPSKKVGDKFDFEIAGKKHVIEILGVRKVPVAVEVDVMEESLPEDLQPKCACGDEAACSDCESCNEDK